MTAPRRFSETDSASGVCKRICKRQQGNSRTREDIKRDDRSTKALYCLTKGHERTRTATSSDALLTRRLWVRFPRVSDQAYGIGRARPTPSQPPSLLREYRGRPNAVAFVVPRFRSCLG